MRAGVLCIGMLWILGCGSLVATRSSTLLGISNPGYPHHTDYLEYQQGRLTEAQLLDRLPHIAMVGDSLSRDFYVSSLVSMIWRSKMNHGRDWFLDTDPSANSVYSLYERLAEETPLVAWEYSSGGGRVDSGGGGKRFLWFWFPLHFSQQTDLILAEKRFPDLVLLWIGHNNLHWEWVVDPRRPEEIETGLQKMAANFRQDYTRQLGRLVERAREQKERRAFIVFGLVNFKSFFEARDAAEQLRKKNPKLYPYFDVVLQRFESTKLEYRANMAKLALMYNEELRAMVGDFNRKMGGDSPVRLEYSDALATLDFSDVECIHRSDAWHPSAKEHSALAAAAFGALRPSLNFLGIVPLRKNTDSR
ncbi:MAG: SGNH/GDSL hydrolase family protein [Deltaproteobacteria bacterium]|nr:SGNH/GDSL hydrolase family protein [Deltaproteobacteria bacterium]